MKGNKLGLALATFIFINANTAAAEVSWTPELYEGDFDVTCDNETSTVAFDIAIAVGTHAWGGVFASPTPCEADSSEVYDGLAEFGADIYEGCMGLLGWIEGADDSCGELAGGLVQGIYNAHKGLVELVPTNMNNMTIGGVGDGWADFWNCYSYTGTSVTSHSAGGIFGSTCEGVETNPWEGQLCDDTVTTNEADAALLINREGNFLAFGLGIAPFANGAACLATVIGGLTGSFDETSSFEVGYGANGSIWCGASNPLTGLLIGTIGVTYAGTASGIRVSPLCRPTGCSGEICSDEPMSSVCTWLPENDCITEQICERQSDGLCGWTPTSTSETCFSELER